MKKLYVYILLVVMIIVSACSHNEAVEDVQAISLTEVELIQIDHGSTTVEVESAEIDSLEAILHLNDNGPGIIIDEGKRKIKIRLKSDIKRMFNIGKMPRLTVRIPSSYEGKVMIEGSSGNVNIKNLNTHQLYIEGSSGNVSLDYLKINGDINVSIKSGNLLLNLEDKESNINWLLQSGSGRRSVAFPLEDYKDSNRKTEGQTGDGSFNVKLQTTSGKITIK